MKKKELKRLLTIATASDEQITRIKENDCAYRQLSSKDKKFMAAVGWGSRQYESLGNKWVDDTNDDMPNILSIRLKADFVRPVINFDDLPVTMQKRLDVGMKPETKFESRLVEHLSFCGAIIICPILSDYSAQQMVYVVNPFTTVTERPRKYRSPNSSDVDTEIEFENTEVSPGKWIKMVYLGYYPCEREYCARDPQRADGFLWFRNARVETRD
ncbi:MAG: hypothetical protein GY841_18555 [FCB group bacterium]|nr:hypothetical protein [FCB group bacterium]